MQQETVTEPKLISLEEASGALGVCLSTVRKWVREGTLASVQVGIRQKRVSHTAINAFIENGGLKGGNR